MLHNIDSNLLAIFFWSLLTSTMTDESATRREANRLAVHKYYSSGTTYLEAKEARVLVR